MLLCAGVVGAVFVRLMKSFAHTEQFKRHQQGTRPAPRLLGLPSGLPAPHTLPETSVHPDSQAQAYPHFHPPACVSRAP